MAYRYNPGFETYQSGNYNSEDDLSTARLNVPSFFGRDDPKGFLSWLDKVEAIFKIQNLSEQRKFGTVLVTFQGAAIGWWNSYYRKM